MPQQRRFRRLGSASTAVSAGALVLVFLGAPAAYAQSAAAPQKCKKGVDPATTIDNWKCQLGNWRDSLTPKPTPTPKPTKPTPKPSKKPPLDKGSGGKERKSGGGKKGGGAPSVSAPTGSLPSGGGATTMNRPEGLQPYAPNGGQNGANLPGLLPTPQVAADPSAYQAPAGTAPQTRLISPVAATEHDQNQILWVAAASGAAGAVLALNLSVLGRRMRRVRS
ncbi:hypothetical protein ACQEU3_34305 [Spirillospora sp. CA-253888]